jgi:hypothetical protein
MENDHFDSTQKIERENFKILFINYFKPHNCSDLIVTSTDDFNCFDALFLSAITKTVLVEYKRRAINALDRTDCFIEFQKYKRLFDWYRSGHSVLYAIEYDDYYVIWNLSTLFSGVTYSTLDRLFYPENMTADCASYSKGKKEKLVRGLKFYDAEYFLTKEFKRVSYQHVLNFTIERRKKEQSKILYFF